jgi:hypothetical protein
MQYPLTFPHWLNTSNIINVYTIQSIGVIMSSSTDAGRQHCQDSSFYSHWGHPYYEGACTQLLDHKGLEQMAKHSFPRKQPEKPADSVIQYPYSQVAFVWLVVPMPLEIYLGFLLRISPGVVRVRRLFVCHCTNDFKYYTQNEISGFNAAVGEVCSRNAAPNRPTSGPLPTA